MSDLTITSRYLVGNFAPTSEQLTRMDAIANKVIEKQDYNRILAYNTGAENPSNITAETLTNGNDETRTYCVYDCGLGTEISPYTLNSNNATSNINTRTFETYDDYRDTENTNTVKIVSSKQVENVIQYSFGSGFAVAGNVIATAAHCVYNKEENSYAQNLIVEVYDRAATRVLNTYEAEYIHIPQLYKTTNNLNYDYALIKIKNNDDGEDISRYGLWSLGCMSTEFIESGANVIASGFTEKNNIGVLYRYYSQGPIVNYTDSAYYDDYGVKNEDENYKFLAQAMSYPGKSGGPVYYETTYNDSTIKSVVGIISHIKKNPDGSLDNRSWCTRITPTLLKFYLNNPNI